MAEFFSLSGLMTLGMLVLLQAVLGFDNLLYISIESKRVEESQQKRVRWVGIIIAIVLRIVMLIILRLVIEKTQEPFFEAHFTWFDCIVNVHSVIVLIGGAFILYTAIKEIFHMIAIHDAEHIEGEKGKQTRSFQSALFWIVLMNVIFSFDSILSAMALTKNDWITTTAIIASGLMMIFLADRVSEFLKKNRMYEVLGLFILFLVGIMLVTEGGHLAHLKFFGQEIEAMSKATFYFTLFFLIVVDIVQSRYQAKLLRQQKVQHSQA